LVGEPVAQLRRIVLAGFAVVTGGDCDGSVAVDEAESQQPRSSGVGYSVPDEAGCGGDFDGRFGVEQVARELEVSGESPREKVTCYFLDRPCRVTSKPRCK
jgi:hypothetical protein